VTLFSLSVATTSEEKATNTVAQTVAEDEDEADNNDVEIAVDGENKKGAEMMIFPVSLKTMLFQVILMLVCCHYSMIMTNWGDPVVNNDKSTFFASNIGSFWIKISM